jgi:hypothetical protein
MRSAIRVFVVLISLGMLLFYLAFMHRPVSDVAYARFHHPTGNYELVVYPYKPPWALRRVWMERSSDSPALVILKDRHGRTIKTQSVEMAQHVESPSWGSHSVSAGLALTLRYE